MEIFQHDLNNLMKQLGFIGTDAVSDFFQKRKHLPNDVLLENAPFWSASQAAFLREEILNDSDWVEAIDQLNSTLHSQTMDE